MPKKIPIYDVYVCVGTDGELDYIPIHRRYADSISNAPDPWDWIACVSEKRYNSFHHFDTMCAVLEYIEGRKGELGNEVGVFMY